MKLIRKQVFVNTVHYQRLVRTTFDSVAVLECYLETEKRICGQTKYEMQNNLVYDLNQYTIFNKLFNKKG